MNKKSFDLHEDVVEDLVALDALDAAVVVFLLDVGLFVAGTLLAVVLIVDVDVAVAFAHPVELDRVPLAQQQLLTRSNSSNGFIVNLEARV